MLVFTRRPGESFLIGDRIEVMVTDVEGDRVRIGIRAPREIKIVRKELLEAVKEENTRASLVEPSALEGLEKIWNADQENN